MYDMHRRRLAHRDLKPQNVMVKWVNLCALAGALGLDSNVKDTLAGEIQGDAVGLADANTTQCNSSLTCVQILHRKLGIFPAQNDPFIQDMEAQVAYDLHEEYGDMDGLPPLESYNASMNTHRTSTTSSEDIPSCGCTSHSHCTLLRDVKEPITCVYRRPHLYPLLLLGDLGFARELGEGVLAQTHCGTPMYMAPELMHQRKYDERADMWSCGLVAMFLALGTLIWEDVLPRCSCLSCVVIDRPIEC